MMISQDCQSNATKDGFLPYFQRIWHLVKRTGKRYKQWQRMKHNLCLLLSMEDRLLKDIGLSRADAVRISTEESFRKFMFQSKSNDMEDRAGQNNKEDVI